MTKKVLAVALSVLLILSALPFAAFADEIPEGTKYSKTTLAGVTTYYDTAFTHNTATTDGVYKLYADANITGRIAPGIFAKDITIDLNGYDLTSTATDYFILLTRAGSATARKSFKVINTASDVSTINTSASNGVAISGKYNDFTLGENVVYNSADVGAFIDKAATGSTITVDGTINAAASFGITVNGSLQTTDPAAAVTVNGTVNGYEAGIYAAGYADYTVNGTVTGKTAIYQKGGNLVVNDGAVVTATGDKAAYAQNGNGMTATGDAIVVEDNAGYLLGSTEIKGGTISSTAADTNAVNTYVADNVAEEEFDIEVSGGTFTAAGEPDTDVAAYLASNAEIDPATGAITAYAAQIGTAKYETLAEAFAAAQDGNKITLLADCGGNGLKAPQGKFNSAGLTVDFAGHTYTVDGELVGSTGTETNGFQLLKNNKITFQNGTIASAKAKILVQNYSDLTLDNMTLDLNNPNYAYAYTLSNNNGDIVIDDTTINANPAGGFAFDVCRYASYPSVNVTVTGDSVINGDVEIFASKGDPKEGLSLNLNGGTMSGDIVLDSTVQDIIENENVEVKKAATFTKEAPEGYKWNEEGVLVIDATAELKGRSVSIADEASINYYVAVNDAYITNYGDTAYVQFTVGGTTTKAMLKDAPTQDVNGVLCYKFSINAKVSEMDKVVSAALYKNDGDASPVVFADYSINAYIAQAIDYFAGNENLVKVLKALRAYGSYMAVAFKGAEHFDAVTADEKAAIEAVNASDIEPYNVDNKNLPSGIEFVSANLSISDTLALNMYFNGDISAYNCKCVDDTIAVVEDGAYEKATIGGLGGSYIDNVFVLNIGEEYYVSYSPISYAYTYLTSVSDADAMSNALRAMFVYAEASSAYFGR